LLLQRIEKFLSPARKQARIIELPRLKVIDYIDRADSQYR